MSIFHYRNREILSYARADLPSSPEAGLVAYDTTYSTMVWSDGTNWIPFFNPVFRATDAKTLAYAAVVGDFGKTITFNNAGTIAATLPASSTLFVGWWIRFIKITDSSGQVDITMNGSDTLDGVNTASAYELEDINDQVVIVYQGSGEFKALSYLGDPP